MHVPLRARRRLTNGSQLNGRCRSLAAAATRLWNDFARARGVEPLLTDGRAEVVAHAVVLARPGRTRRVNRHPTHGVNELLSNHRRLHLLNSLPLVPSTAALPALQP